MAHDSGAVGVEVLLFQLLHPMGRCLPIRLGALLLGSSLAVTLPLHGLAAPAMAAQELQCDSRFDEAAGAGQTLAGREGVTSLPHAAALALVRQLICLRAAGRDGAADALIPRLAAVDASSVIPGDEHLPQALLTLAQIEQIRQRPDLADALLGRGFALSVKGLGEDHELSRQFIWAALAMSIVADREKEDSAGPGPDSSSDGEHVERRLAIQRLAREETGAGDRSATP